MGLTTLLVCDRDVVLPERAPLLESGPPFSPRESLDEGKEAAVPADLALACTSARAALLALLAVLPPPLLCDAGAGTLLVMLLPFFFPRGRSGDERGVAPDCSRSCDRGVGGFRFACALDVEPRGTSTLYQCASCICCDVRSLDYVGVAGTNMYERK